nr:1-deoxy-D-xylulose-5-phosphate synthase [uncultured Niameybacter sp.]
MLKTLDSIKSVEDLKQLDIDELQLLAKDVRQFLIQSLARTGGHLASNLGVVELTLALHYVFDSPKDKMVWDVGHQAYVHKLLTGRRKGFKTLRKTEGMSGFPKRKESVHDVFETGHSSTSISAAIGMAVARDLRGDDSHVIAVIGDGALTGGMAYEALNNAGRGHTNLIVILNDNEMSISENVGGMSRHLNHLRSSHDYLRAKQDIEGLLHKVPLVGSQLVDVVRKTKEGVKTVFIENTLFEEMGLTYLGPIDGHNINELIEILNNAKAMEGPVLIHVKTIKGRGYKPAVENPSAYHGVGPFDYKTGVIPKKAGGYTFSDAFGYAMVSLGEKDERILGITAAMSDGTGLNHFEKQFPKRFFDVGIAEQHAVTFSAGLAASGYKPVFAVYSSFLQRAYDQVLHDVALQNLPVVFGIDRAGLVGEDGATHQGIFDIAYLSHIPNMTLLSVKMPEEMESALQYALSLNAPVAIRYPRGSVSLDSKYQISYNDGRIVTLEEGEEIALVATGKMVAHALKVKEVLDNEGYKVAVVEVPCIKPLDEEGLSKLCDKYTYLFTMEDHVIKDGFGAQIAQWMVLNGKTNAFHSFGYQTGIVEHGDIPSLLEIEHLSVDHLVTQIKQLTRKERA